MLKGKSNALVAGIFAVTAIFSLCSFALAEEAAAPQPSLSQTMRQTVETNLNNNQDAQASEALKEILGSDKYEDIRGWANEEYYKLAEKKGNIPEAIKELEKLSKNAPKNKELKKSTAEGYVKLRDWNSVGAVYEDLLKDDPNDYVAFVRLIDAYMLQKNYTEVIRRLEPIVQANPDDAGNSDTLAFAYVGAGRQTEAINLYRKKLEKAPDSPGLRGTYAQALTNFGMLDEALQEWQKAYALDPQNSFFKMRIDEVSGKLGKTPTDTPGVG